MMARRGRCIVSTLVFFLLEKTQHVYNPIGETCPKNGIPVFRAQKGTKGQNATGN